MKKTWLYRLWLSYFPVFFLTVLALIVGSFFTIVELSRRESFKTNEIFAKQVLQTIDQSLQIIEQTIVKEAQSGRDLEEFVNQNAYDDPFLNIQISELLGEIQKNTELIESIYLVHLKDNVILTPGLTVKLEQFGDRDFITQLLDSAIPATWTQSRWFTDEQKQQQQVVTLVRKVPLSSFGKGLIVVNVGIPQIKKILDRSFASKLNYADLIDRDGNMLFQVNGNIIDSNERDIQPYSWTTYTSDYNAWQIRSGFIHERWFGILSTVSYIWFIAGLAAIVGGSTWIVYATRRNYKPIEAIVDMIHSHALLRSLPLRHNGKNDEFGYIQSAIEGLLNESNSYQQQHKEDLVFKRRHLFHEVLEGHGPTNRETWQMELGSLQVPKPKGAIGVVIVEIDHYVAFSKRYSSRDQFLLRFVVNSVLVETGQNLGHTLWAEWLSNHQMGVMIMLGDQEEQPEASVSELCSSFQSWVEANLDFTVTIGLGTCTEELAELPACYLVAVEALKYKAVLGSNRLINAEAFKALIPSLTVDRLKEIQMIIHAYRLGDAEWESLFFQLIAHIETGSYTKDEIISLMNHFIDLLQQELTASFGDLGEEWHQRVVAAMKNFLSEFDVIRDIKRFYGQVLTESRIKLLPHRDTRKHLSLLWEIRTYIEEHYVNPELSLNHLSDSFGMSPKYISMLFKQEFNENFMDHLMKVRMEHAKRLLKETNENIQSISNQVGYLNSASFNRAFKKCIGLTPGEYRKG